MVACSKFSGQFSISIASFSGGGDVSPSFQWCPKKYPFMSKTPTSARIAHHPMAANANPFASRGGEQSGRGLLNEQRVAVSGGGSGAIPGPGTFFLRRSVAGCLFEIIKLRSLRFTGRK